MFYFNSETGIQKEYNALLNRASSRDPSTEELEAIITDLVRLDNKIQILSSNIPISSRLHFQIKELAFSIVYDRRETLGKLPEKYRLSDSKLLEGYRQLKEHPGFAEFSEKAAIHKKVNRYISNLEKDIASSMVNHRMGNAA